MVRRGFWNIIKPIENGADILFFLDFNLIEDRDSIKTTNFEGIMVIHSDMSDDEYFIKESALIKEFRNRDLKLMEPNKPTLWDKFKIWCYHKERESIFIFIKKKVGKIYSALKAAKK